MTDFDLTACPCGQCPKAALPLVPAIADALRDLRASFPHQLRVTSGWRCRSYNKTVGGAPASRHLTGDAVDLITTNPLRLRPLADLARNHPSIHCVILYDDHVHIDCRSSATYYADKRKNPNSPWPSPNQAPSS